MSLTHNTPSTFPLKRFRYRKPDGYAIYRHTQTAGTDGGSTTSGSWQTVTLNDTQASSGSDISRSSNTITLAAGTYAVSASMVFRECQFTHIRFRNTSDSQTDITGGTCYAYGTNAFTPCHLLGKVTVASSKDFELQYRVTSAQATDGQGSATNATESEVYAVVYIRKIPGDVSAPDLSLATEMTAYTQQEHAIIREVLTSSTETGGFTSGAWRTRTLDTLDVLAGSGISLASNQITVPAGKYLWRSWCPAFYCNEHQSQLYDATGAAYLLQGTSSKSGNSGAYGTPYSHISGLFEVDVESDLELHHRCTTSRVVNGLGVTSTWESFTSAMAEIVRVA